MPVMAMVSMMTPIVVAVPVARVGGA